MAGIVEKLNPRKPSALSKKRDAQRAGLPGRAVGISELTLDEVKQDAVAFGLATDVSHQMNAGKEASIYLAYWHEHPIILKAYRLWRTSQASKRKGFYAPGKMEALAAKEFDLLFSCHKAGVHVPTPIGRVGNYLTMRFIGDAQPAPQLRNVVLDEPDLVLDQILDDYLVMYRDVNYVHGDLSGYNILWWKGRPWVIDVPQAYKVGPWADMHHVVKLLRRDIVNTLRAFKPYGIRRNPDQILEVFLSEYIPENHRTFREGTFR